MGCDGLLIVATLRLAVFEGRFGLVHEALHVDDFMYGLRMSCIGDCSKKSLSEAAKYNNKQNDRAIVKI